MPGHVDDLDGHPDGFHHGILHRLRVPDRSHYGPVVILVRLIVEEFDAGFASEGRDDFLNSSEIPAFTEVRYRFDNLT